MKIRRITETGPAGPAEGAKGTGKTEGEFERVFQEELNQQGSGSQAVGLQDAGISPLATAAPVALFGLEGILAGESGQVEHKIESAIDGLDQVGRMLRDPQVTPKKVDDAILSLTTQAEELSRATKGLPVDHPLQRIANEVSVLATVESIKWKRGDYL